MAATIPVATATPEAAIAQREQRERALAPANAPANAAAIAVAGPIPGHAVRVLDHRTEYSFAGKAVRAQDVDAIARQFEKLTLVDVTGARIDGAPCIDVVTVRRLFPHHPKLTVKGVLDNTATYMASQMSPVDGAKYIGLVAGLKTAFETTFTDLNVVMSDESFIELCVDHAGEAVQAIFRALPFFVEMAALISKYPALSLSLIRANEILHLSPDAVAKVKSSLRRELKEIYEALAFAISNIDFTPCVRFFHSIVVDVAAKHFRANETMIVAASQHLQKTEQGDVEAIKAWVGQVFAALLEAYLKADEVTFEAAVETAFTRYPAPQIFTA